MTIQPNQTTREFALQNPGLVPVLERLGIDYCCGGAKTLLAASQRANVEWSQLIQALEAAGPATGEPLVDWGTQPLGSLTRHIVDTHHAYVRRTVPQIENWLEKVAAKHGKAHPEVVEIRDLFAALAEELAVHMMKEERILFPVLERLGATRTVAAPIRQMMAEHDNAGELLAQMRKLANGYEPPAGACPTFRALYQGLSDFERDLHEHVHLENNILFPRAVEREDEKVAAV